jgi:UDP-N-acetylglucosamine--N-acetylmuramyl-(pentapeptide) pyrophosphoryl-undecaprenol N-acetylglucosamine transferase
MSEKDNKYRFLFAGGGTGGHLFPAVAVADKIKSLIPEAEILFIGTKSKIEGKVVPELGYKFSSIWIKGFARKFNAENLLFPIKLIVSLIQSIIINMKFRPKVAIGSGGYVSGPAIYGASLMGAKIILLEQNSYPGVTTRLLEKYADEVHISFDDSRKYFRFNEKLHLTGNPVRESLKRVSKAEATSYFNMTADKKTLLVLGGSLGATAINQSVASVVKEFEKADLQVIWQTGRLSFDAFKSFESDNVRVLPFIEKMDIAYSACDLLLARAGGITIAEFLTLAIPCILVPSPNVAENHQYYNAKSLSDQGAAVLIDEKFLKDSIFDKVISLIGDEKSLAALRVNAQKLAKPEAAAIIAQQAIRYAEAI